MWKYENIGLWVKFYYKIQTEQRDYCHANAVV